jgi:hypothetical protein
MKDQAFAHAMPMPERHLYGADDELGAEVAGLASPPAASTPRAGITLDAGGERQSAKM